MMINLQKEKNKINGKQEKYGENATTAHRPTSWLEGKFNNNKKKTHTHIKHMPKNKEPEPARDSHCTWNADKKIQSDDDACD